MHKGFLKIAAVLGLIAVALGAFGAHGLKNVVSAQAVATFETGVRYQFYHVFALIAVALLYKEFPAVKTAGWLFITGIILFSGSLYALALVQGMVQPGFKWLGPITPLGGLFFIVGWAALFLAINKKRS
ncbi:MAG TPA: DUF423 domain-containing protein [Ferruginibacter sp.]|nr:DUF423 domain-containing protein [Ferruginibacter sp.]HRE63145.1 DUF423 domain-containing protein [Ferruginibacter sp.]